MKKKLQISLAVLAIGIALTIFALYERARIAEAHGEAAQGGGLFSHNPVSEAITSSVQHEISSYETPVLLCLIAGIVIMVVGAGMTIAYFKKSKR